MTMQEVFCKAVPDGADTVVAVTFRKGVIGTVTYEALMFSLGLAMLVVQIITYCSKK
ncbi:MAG: hypothetical protein RR560_09615 [Hydrogenoanaerobacterium sp.]